MKKLLAIALLLGIASIGYAVPVSTVSPVPVRLISSAINLTVTTNGAPLPVNNLSGLLADMNGLGLNVRVSSTPMASTLGGNALFAVNGFYRLTTAGSGGGDHIGMAGVKLLDFTDGMALGGTSTHGVPYVAAINMGLIKPGTSSTGLFARQTVTVFTASQSTAEDGIAAHVKNVGGLLAEVNGAGLNVKLSGTITAAGNRALIVKTEDSTVTASLAAGTNNIGDVDVATIAAGDNNIGNVDVVTLPALAAGTNNIGDVDVLTLPDIPVKLDVNQEGTLVNQSATGYLGTATAGKAAAVFDVGMVSALGSQVIAVDPEAGATVVIPSGIEYFQMEVCILTGATMAIFASTADMASAVSGTAAACFGFFKVGDGVTTNFLVEPWREDRLDLAAPLTVYLNTPTGTNPGTVRVRYGKKK